VIGALSSHAPTQKVVNQIRHPKPGTEVLNYLKEKASQTKKFQTVVASATVNAGTRHMLLKNNWIKDPLRAQFCDDSVSLPASITHQFVFVKDEQERLKKMMDLAAVENPTAGVIFVNNETNSLTFSKNLSKSGLKKVFPLLEAYVHESNFVLSEAEENAEKANSDIEKTKKSEEEKSLPPPKEFINSPVLGLLQGKIQFLVANHEAARGIDLPNISHVFVWDLPSEIQGFFPSGRENGADGQTWESHHVCRSIFFVQGQDVCFPFGD